ncbi:MAG: fibronectin type III domain-containing protein, partial [Thermoguttaceae bacterium]|nr:fibronectin type III domain-containing protein [Thermoguttaceae bacterium]
APTGASFGAYDADSESATLTWVDNADNEAGYRVEVKGADGSWTVVEELAADSTSYVVEGLAAGATYEYRVSAFNDAGASSTVSATITTPEKLTAPTAPTGAAFGAYDADSESATLTWIDNADNEAGYRVEVKGADGSWTVVETLGADATSYVATGLAAGTTYEYRVRRSTTPERPRRSKRRLRRRKTKNRNRKFPPLRRTSSLAPTTRLRIRSR